MRGLSGRVRLAHVGGFGTRRAKLRQYAAFPSSLVVTLWVADRVHGETTVITKKTGTDVSGKRAQGAVRRPASAGKCRCGQDLDMSARAHCPRCGSTVRSV